MKCGVLSNPKKHTYSVRKRNTQKIERKHLTLRTRIKRLARKTICFSKSCKVGTRAKRKKAG
jgi:IS1 family transposase